MSESVSSGSRITHSVTYVTTCLVAAGPIPACCVPRHCEALLSAPRSEKELSKQCPPRSHEGGCCGSSCDSSMHQLLIGCCICGFVQIRVKCVTATLLLGF